MSDDALEKRLDELYSGPLDGFVKARDGLAAELKKAGNKDGAAAVKARPRPTVSAWAVNRLWRAARKDFEALLGAGDDLREAQRHALSGGGGDKMKKALADRRSAVAKLVARAKEELEEGGHAASAATLHRVESTLHTVATIGERGDLGRMAGDVGDDGLEGLLAFGGGLDLAPAERPKKEPEKKVEPKEPKAHGPKIDPALKKATDRAEAAKEAFAVAEAQTKDRKHAATAAEKDKERRRAELEGAKVELKSAEEALREARLAVDAAEKAARLADREADLATRSFAEAERIVDRARVEKEAAIEALRAAKG